MKNIIVLGQSPAVHTAVKALLERDASLGVTVISCDGELPYDRMLLPGLIDRSVKEKDLLCATQDFYAAAQVQVVLDQEISRINFDRRRIFCAARPQVNAKPNEAKTPAAKMNFDFDGLIMADAPELRLPQLKGIRRQGVFHLARLETVRNLIRYLPFTETVIVEPLGFAGIRAALALKSVGKDVIVLARQETLLSGVLSTDRAKALALALEKRGVRVFAATGGIEDIIGEVEVKALRLKSGKVIACDMVVTEDIAADLRFLDETPLAVLERIPVTSQMASLVAAVAAIEGVCQMELPAFLGNYWINTDVGCTQAKAAVNSLWSEGEPLTASDLVPREILEPFFHAQELAPTLTEVTVL